MRTSLPNAKEGIRNERALERLFPRAYEEAADIQVILVTLIEMMKDTKKRIVLAQLLRGVENMRALAASHDGRDELVNILNVAELIPANTMLGRRMHKMRNRINTVLWAVPPPAFQSTIAPNPTEPVFAYLRPEVLTSMTSAPVRNGDRAAIPAGV